MDRVGVLRRPRLRPPCRGALRLTGSGALCLEGSVACSPKRRMVRICSRPQCLGVCAVEHDHNGVRASVCLPLRTRALSTSAPCPGRNTEAPGGQRRTIRCPGSRCSRSWLREQPYVAMVTSLSLMVLCSIVVVALPWTKMPSAQFHSGALCQRSPNAPVILSPESMSPVSPRWKPAPRTLGLLPLFPLPGCAVARRLETALGGAGTGSAAGGIGRGAGTATD